MKTIEEKARAYDRAKDIMEKYLKSGNAGVIAENTIKNAFPELHENEDKIVKEELINYLKYRCNSTTLSGEERACNKWIDWLEKQGESEDKGEISDGYHTFNELYYYRMLYNAAFFNMLPKEWVHKSKKHHDGEDCFGGGWFIVMANLPTGQISNHYELKDWDLFQIPEKKVADKWDGHTPQEAADRLHKYLLKKQGEQKPADYEPKFHEGEWITNGDYIWKIVEVKPLDYILQSQDGNIVDDTISHVDEQFHSFTIEDAKEGDVIVNGSNIFIFHFINDTRLMGYCHVNTDDGRFYDDIGKNECFCLIDAVVNPATKEQRDNLFAKMHEAGYMWDSKSKQLLSLKAEPSDIQTSTGWSHEDDVKRIEKKQKEYDAKLRDKMMKAKDFPMTVDLEKEISDYLTSYHLHIKDGGRVVFDNNDSPNFMCDIRHIAKHFFEVGLKAQKGWSPKNAIVIEGICSDKDFIDTKHGILAFGAEEGSYRPFNDGDKVKIIIIRKE